MIRTAFAALALLAPLPLAAQTVTGDAAAAMLFAPQPAEVEIVKDVLPKDQAKMLAMVAKDQPYYAAIAISPDEGLMSEATMAAANHHTVEAAVAAALAQCNAKKAGATDCVIAATVVRISSPRCGAICNADSVASRSALTRIDGPARS